MSHSTRFNGLNLRPGAIRADDDAYEKLKACAAKEKVTCELARAHAACLWAVWAVWLLNVAAGVVRFHSCSCHLSNACAWMVAPTAYGTVLYAAYLIDQDSGT